MVVPLALTTKDPIGIPLAFGFETGLPVFLFSILQVTGVKQYNSFLGKIKGVEI